MSSSSSPSPGSHAVGEEGTRLAIEEIEEAEAILDQTPPKAESALCEGRMSSAEEGWVTAMLAAPGFLWLVFYLLAQLVVIILVSFWTRIDSGFAKNWTLSNYGDLFHVSTYWHNMLTTFETSLIAVIGCLVGGYPVAY